MIAISPTWQPSISEGEAGIAFDPIQAAQGEDELEQAFAAGKVVVKCWEPGCLFHRLPHWPAEVWVSVDSRDYLGYSHGICPLHLHQYQREMARFAVPDPVIEVTGSADLAVLVG